MHGHVKVGRRCTRRVQGSNLYRVPELAIHTREQADALSRTAALTSHGPDQVEKLHDEEDKPGCMAKRGCAPV